MALREIFPPRFASGGPPLVFDFTGDLATGETISTAAVSVAAYAGTDASAASMVSGAETISGATVSQALTAGVAGVVYQVTCSITTSTSRNFIHTGLLAVIGESP